MRLKTVWSRWKPRFWTVHAAALLIDWPAPVLEPLSQMVWDLDSGLAHLPNGLLIPARDQQMPRRLQSFNFCYIFCKQIGL